MQWSRVHRAKLIAAIGTAGLLLYACAGPAADEFHAPRASVLRSGDRFLVYDRNAPEFRHLGCIRADGLTTLPYVGRQFLIGMNERDAAVALTAEYRRHFEDVELQVHRIAASRSH